MCRSSSCAATMGQFLPALRRGWCREWMRCDRREARSSRRRPPATGLLLGVENLVGEPVDQTHEEVSRAHGGIADLQGKDCIRRIEGLEFGKAVRFRAAVAGQPFRRLAKARDPLLDERADGALDDQGDQFFRRVVAARYVPGGIVGVDLDRTVVPRPEAVLQDSLIDRTELLDREVAIVDVPRPATGSSIRLMTEAEDHLGHRSVRQLHPREDRRDVGREQPAIVGRDSEVVVAGRNRLEDGRQPRP